MARHEAQALLFSQVSPARGRVGHHMGLSVLADALEEDRVAARPQDAGDFGEDRGVILRRDVLNDRDGRDDVEGRVAEG